MIQSFITFLLILFSSLALPAQPGFLAAKKQNTATGTLEIYSSSGGSDLRIESCTPHPEINRIFSLALAANGDLIVIRRNQTGSGATELRRLSAVSNYRNYGAYAITALPETDSSYTFALGPHDDLFVIRREATPPGTTRLQVLTAASSYQHVKLKAALPSNDIGDDVAFLVSPEGDLLAVQSLRTASGFVEMTTFTAASRYRKNKPPVITPLPSGGARYHFGLSPKGDLLSFQEAGPGKVLVSTVSALRLYRRLGRQTFIRLPGTSSDFAFFPLAATTLAAPPQPDEDKDGVPDYCDLCPGQDDKVDSDGDLIPDGCDGCPDHNDRQDEDDDGVPDACDQCRGYDDRQDEDGDGVPDACDRCPGHSDATDSDRDGTADGCDRCPGENDRKDKDHDGTPDACDRCDGHPDHLDTDHDGIADGCDICPGFPDQEDQDGDGVPDGCDRCPGESDRFDADNDGIPNPCDRCVGYDDRRDGDRDKVPDACDRCAGYDDRFDEDGDGIPDACDQCPGEDDRVDQDRDGLPDCAEGKMGLIVATASQQWTGELLTLLAREEGVGTIPGDFNGDGKLDFALLKDGFGWISMPVALSNGDGTFRMEDQPLGDFIQKAAETGAETIPGDFNGDGNTDILLVNPLAVWSSFPLALSNGDGTFTVKDEPDETLVSKARTPGVQIIPGDFNGDGSTDLALVRRNAGWKSVPVFFSDRSGNFVLADHPLESFAASARERNVLLLAGDYNGDGATDLAIVRSSGGCESIPTAYSRRDGSFMAADKEVSYLNYETAEPQTGDFNGDGLTDIAFVKADGRQLPIAFSEGEGVYRVEDQSVLPGMSTWAPDPSTRVLIGHFNGDKVTDMLFVKPNKRQLAAALFNTEGAFDIELFEAPHSAFFDNWIWKPVSNALLLGDFNGDGLTDIGLVRASGAFVPVGFSTN